jgi:NADH-quinone oxidoreductase subunit N
MSLTEAYIVSIPESFLILAVSVLVINGLVGIKKPAFVQNVLLERTSENESQKEHGPLALSAGKVDKSILPLGILSLALAISLVYNIDVTYVGRFILDDYSKIIKIIVLCGAGVILLIALDLIRIGTRKTSIHGGRYTRVFLDKASRVGLDGRNLEPYLELVSLLILAIVGLMVIISSYDLLSLYVGIELQSLALYVLATYKGSSEFSTEAGLKYFILGALASGFILFGGSIIYGLTGTIQFEEIAKVLILEDFHAGNTALIGIFFVISGLFFKASIAPFHQWTPDVYEGSPMLITLFFASIPKLAIFSVLIRVLNLIPESLNTFGTSEIQTLGLNTPYELVTQLLILSAILSMSIGALTGLYQQKIKRLFAYSTILNMGYLLIGLITFSIEGLQALFFSLFIYILSNIGLFTILLAVKEYRNNKLYPLIYITEIKKIRNQPLLAFSFIIILCSLAGFPPLAGFFGKLYLFFSAIALEYYLLSIVGVLLSVISCFYYLRLIKYLYFAPLQSQVFLMPLSLIHSLILSIVVLSLILLIVYPGPLLTLSLSLALNILA